MILIFLTSITAICAEENSTILQDGFSDLQTKINQTDENGILELDEDYYIQGNYGEDNNLKIEKNMTIEGNGKSITQSQSIINISECEVTFRDLTFDHATICASNSRVWLVNCTFMNHYEESYFINEQTLNHYYSIDVKGGCLDIINSTFININRIMNVDGNLNIANSNFTQSSFGFHATDATIFNSTFTDLSYFSIVADNLDLRKSRITNTSSLQGYSYLESMHYYMCPMIVIYANSTLRDNVFINNTCIPS